MPSPFSFDLDDLEVTGAIFEPEETEPSEYGRTMLHDSRAQRAGARVPGVWVTHRPTGRQVISTMMPTRDENLAVALRRLDRMVRDAAR